MYKQCGGHSCRQDKGHQTYELCRKLEINEIKKPYIT